jgi:thiol-disulfide isomerase/thioredoxin
MAGLIVLLVVLAGATAFGLTRRRRDGRLTPVSSHRPAGQTGPPPPGRPAEQDHSAQPDGTAQRISTAQLGQPLGARATLLQFSSEFCAPCRATRQILDEVASGTDGVTHVEVDAADRLDLVRLLDVRRTPTVFVLGPDGQVTQRGSGLMRKAEVLAALGEAG